MWAATKSRSRFSNLVFQMHHSFSPSTSIILVRHVGYNQMQSCKRLVSGMTLVVSMASLLLRKYRLTIRTWKLFLRKILSKLATLKFWRPSYLAFCSIHPPYLAPGFDMTCIIWLGRSRKRKGFTSWASNSKTD